MRTTAISRAAGAAALTLTLAAADAAAARDTTPPTAPTNLRAIDIDHDAVTLDWSPSTDDVGVLGYCVEVNGEPYGGACDDPMSFGFGPPPNTIFWLREGTTFRIEVRAKDAARNVSDPAVLTVTTGTFDAPRNLRVLQQQGGDLTLAWDAPTFCDDECRLGYRIFDGTRLETITGDETISIQHLAPGTHTLRVTATTPPRTVRTTPPSEPVTVTVPGTDRTPPTTPTNYRARFESEFPPPDVFGTWIMTWDESTDDVSPRSAIEYDALLFDNQTNQFWVTDYSFARGTGTFQFDGRDSTGPLGPIRAADEAGNASPPTGWPAG